MAIPARSVPGNPRLGEALYLTGVHRAHGNRDAGHDPPLRRGWSGQAGLRRHRRFCHDEPPSTAARPWGSRRRATCQVTGPVSGDRASGYPSKRSQLPNRRASRGASSGSRAFFAVRVGWQGRIPAVRLSSRGRSSKALQTGGGYAGRTCSFERRLRRMLAEGLLAMTDPAKPRSPRQRYRLTDRARAAPRACIRRNG